MGNDRLWIGWIWSQRSGANAVLFVYLTKAWSDWIYIFVSLSISSEKNFWTNTTACFDVTRTTIDTHEVL